MSRSQETTATNTAAGENSGYYNEAQNSYANAQQGEQNYEKQLGQYAGDVGKYAASNPYTQGGQFQTAENQQLSNTADAGAQSAGQQLQSQALRTGQNSNADVAATEDTQQQNERTLAGQEAGATQQRIGSQAQYNQGVLGAQQGLLNASAQPAQFEAGLAGSEAGQGNAALGEQVKAAGTPSWMDEFGNATAEGLGKLLTGNSASEGRCWIAAELYGGWYEPRTVLIRGWLNTEFEKTIIGRGVMALYGCFGERIAEQIHKHPVLRKVFLPIFNLALAKAQRGK